MQTLCRNLVILEKKLTFFANFRSSIKSSSPWESSKIAWKKKHKYSKISLFNLSSTCELMSHSEQLFLSHGAEFLC